MEDDIELVSDDKTDIVQNNISNISWIILQDYTKLPAIKILKYQTYVTSFIKQNFNIFVNINIEYKIKEFIKNENIKDDFHKYVNWLIITTEQLCKNSGQKTIVPKIDYSVESAIARSSYKFCNYKSKCVNEYKKNNCTKHHFVYDLLYTDINSLNSYLESSKDLSIEEITKSINTINYVLHHMLNELTELNYSNYTY